MIVTPVIPPQVALSPASRAILYKAYAVAGLLVGTVQTVYLAAQLEQQVWLTAAVAAYLYLGAALGLTAASNTPVDPPQYDPPVWDRTEDGTRPAAEGSRYLDADGDNMPDVAS